MARPMRTSETGVELIKSFEGFRARASQLPDGRWLIGYGHTRTARKGLNVTRADANLILRHYDLRAIEALLHRTVYTPLNQNEFDALASFAFNIGAKAFAGSDVLALLNTGERLSASEAMASWRRGRVDGQVRIVDALVRRRAAEIALFLDHPSGPQALPSALLRPERDTLAMSQPGPETSIIVEARPDADRTRAQRPTERESGPQAAARAVSERLTRILGENASRASGMPVEPALPAGTDPTVDEITRAVSALADPEAQGDLPAYTERAPVDRRRAPRPAPPPVYPDAPTLPPAESAIVDDLAPAEIDPSRIEMALAEDGFGLGSGKPLSRWLPFALLAGLSTIGLYDGIRRFLSLSGTQLAERAPGIYLGPLVALGSGFLLMVSSYYLYRVLAHED